LLEKFANATILENMSLRRLEAGGSEGRIVAAHAMSIDEKKPLVVRARHYILAMGGIETPRMLMLSADNGIHKHGLGNTGGHLGSCFSDHLHPSATLNISRSVGRRLGFETMVTDHFRVRKNRSEQPTFLLFGAPAMDWFPIGNETTSWAIKDSILSLEDLRNSIPQIATLTAMTELEGKSKLELDESKLDTFGSPVAKITMNLTDRDRKSINEFTMLTSRIGEAMGAVIISEVSSELGLGYHPSGTTAMARTPDEGVCDPDLKVFGLDNLYLVSNSVFPHMSANPPTLTIAALALRLAAHLKGRAVLCASTKLDDANFSGWEYPGLYHCHFCS
jgi:choline dehydrogenase-like flavoprotein